MKKRNPIAKSLRVLGRRVVEDKRRKVDVNLWKRIKHEHFRNRS
jgi:hypothetical protein